MKGCLSRAGRTKAESRTRPEISAWSIPTYFDYADRRIAHLVDAGIVPAIVGGWGRGDCDGMKLAGVDGHQAALAAPDRAVWRLSHDLDHRRRIAAGRCGPRWPGTFSKIDPYHRPVDHASVPFGPTVRHRRNGHRFRHAPDRARRLERRRSVRFPKLQAAYARTPAMPVMIGEYCYEGHMQTAFQDVQRYVFWGSMLSGSAGLTYGAAGVWHASVEGDPGLANVYDLTTWKEGMNYPGSTQLGLGKKLLEQYPWWRFEPHPEWAEEGSFRRRHSRRGTFHLQPKRGIYNWTGPRVIDLERDVPYRPSTSIRSAGDALNWAR